MKELKSLLWIGTLALVLAAPAFSFAKDKTGAPDQERQLIAILQSSASPDQKAVPCKQLAIYGTKRAVPALAALLENEELASWARIALEAIPDRAADDALRAALDRVHGRLLVGVINSIGVKKDEKAIGALARQLDSADEEVACAAAVALGQIGGTKAAGILARTLATAKPALRSAAAQGTILCGEKFLAQGKHSKAIAAYDLVRQADVPKIRLAEATRGAILARESGGLELLLAQLRSADKDFIAIGLSTARELPGRKVTEALAMQLPTMPAARQAPLLLAIADRHDSSVLPAILEAAKSGSTDLRLTAIGVLDRAGDVSSVPVLLELATSSDAQLRAPAITALARLPGNEVDADLLHRLQNSSGKLRQALLDVAGRRRIEAALPVIVRSTEDPDPNVRGAAAQAIAAIGDDKQVADLVRLLGKCETDKERAEVETALISLTGRSGSSCVPHLLGLARNEKSDLRLIGLHALASAGGAQALAAIKSALEDRDESVQDEAVRTLSTWPNNWPEDQAVAEPLLELARSGKKESHQVLAMRGYLEYVKADKHLKQEDKAARINQLLPLLKRPEEKRQAIAAIDEIPNAAALEMLTAMASEPEITEDACSAILTLTGKKAATLSKAQRQKALELVVESTKNDGTKTKASKLLKEIQ